MSLPPEFDPNDLVLKEATEEERLQSWRNNSASWKGKLTVEEYIGQQLVNGTQVATRNGGIRYWVFTDGNKIYTSAETLRKPAITRLADGSCAEVCSFGVAGVYTLPQYRRRGIASAMMRQLASWLDKQDPPAHFTVLWSAVGDFYKRFGWDIVDTQEAVIAIPLQPSPIPVGVTFLGKDHLKLLCEQDVETFSSQFKHSTLSNGRLWNIGFLPSFDQATWYFASEEYVANKIFQSQDQVPSNKGAMSSSGEVWCYWLHDFNADALRLLRLVLPCDGVIQLDKAKKGEELIEVFKAAIVEASRWNLKEITIWDPHSHLLQVLGTATGIEFDVREEIRLNIPCIRSRMGTSPGSSHEGVEWLCRQMYPWC